MIEWTKHVDGYTSGNVGIFPADFGGWEVCELRDGDWQEVWPPVSLSGPFPSIFASRAAAQTAAEKYINGLTVKSQEWGMMKRQRRPAILRAGWRAELWQGDMMVAKVHGATADDVKNEINHYAMMYEPETISIILKPPTGRWQYPGTRCALTVQTGNNS